MTHSPAKNDWVHHAYVDGELEPADKIQVERDIAQDHEARVAIEAWRRQKEALKQAYAKVMEEELPPRLKAALSARRAEPGRRYLPAAAAALLAIAAGAYVIYANLGFNQRDAKAFAETALSAHVVYSTEVRHPVEVTAMEKDHLVAWLSKRLGQTIKAPNLASHGFQLVGGRLLHEGRKPAAQFMYEDASKRRLTIYIAHNPSNRETAFRIDEEGAFTTCYWLDGATGYAVAAEIPAHELLPLARLVYESLDAES